MRTAVVDHTRIITRLRTRSGARSGARSPMPNVAPEAAVVASAMHTAMPWVARGVLGGVVGRGQQQRRRALCRASMPRSSPALTMVPPREPLIADSPQQKAAAVLWRAQRTQSRPRMPHLRERRMWV